MKKNSLHIDGIDKIIIKHLTKNARSSILGIAREVGVSGAAVHQRLRKLEASGLLKGSKYIVNPKILGYNTLAFIGVFIDTSVKYKDVIKKFEEIPEVMECHYTTGNYSLFIKLLCKDNEHLMLILNKHIQGINGVSRIETFISLDQQIDRQINI